MGTLGVDRPGFQAPLCPCLAVGPWMGKPLSLTGPQFPRLYDGDNYHTALSCC